MQIYSLSYHSKSLLDEDSRSRVTEIEDILKISRERNASVDVTGALLFTDGRFTQVLEGYEQHVRDIYSSIKRDPRHTDVTLLSLQHVAQRRFTSWSMAYVGRLQKSREVYRNFQAQGELHPVRLSSDALCRLMLQMIEIESDSDEPGNR